MRKEHERKLPDWLTHASGESTNGSPLEGAASHHDREREYEEHEQGGAEEEEDHPSGDGSSEKVLIFEGAPYSNRLSRAFATLAIGRGAYRLLATPHSLTAAYTDGSEHTIHYAPGMEVELRSLSLRGAPGALVRYVLMFLLGLILAGLPMPYALLALVPAVAIVCAILRAMFIRRVDVIVPAGESMLREPPWQRHYCSYLSGVWVLSAGGKRRLKAFVESLNELIAIHLSSQQQISGRTGCDFSGDAECGSESPEERGGGWST